MEIFILAFVAFLVQKLVFAALWRSKKECELLYQELQAPFNSTFFSKVEPELC